MSEITEISPQVKDKNRCNIYVDGSFYCGMKLETAVRSRLKVGQHVEKAFLDELRCRNGNLDIISSRFATVREEL